MSVLSFLYLTISWSLLWWAVETQPEIARKALCTDKAITNVRLITLMLLWLVIWIPVTILSVIWAIIHVNRN